MGEGRKPVWAAAASRPFRVGWTGLGHGRGGGEGLGWPEDGEGRGRWAAPELSLEQMGSGPGGPRFLAWVLGWAWVADGAGGGRGPAEGCGGREGGIWRAQGHHSTLSGEAEKWGV